MSHEAHNVTITKALVEGVNTARRQSDELRAELMGARFGSTHYEDLERQIDLMEEWAKELGEALVWLKSQKGGANGNGR